MSDTNALDMFKSLFDNKLESNYLWSFKSGIQNKTIASTLEAVEVLIQYYIPNMGIPQKEVHTRIHAGNLLTLITMDAHTLHAPVHHNFATLCKHSDWRDHTLTCSHTHYNS